MATNSALACIYYATYAVRTIYTVVEPRGWIDSTGWVSDVDECTWFGLTCNANNEVEKIVLVSQKKEHLFDYVSFRLPTNVLTCTLGFKQDHRIFPSRNNHHEVVHHSNGSFQKLSLQYR